MSSWRVGLLVAGSAFLTAVLAAATTARRADVPVAASLVPAPAPESVAAAVARLDDAPDLAASMALLRERLADTDAPRIGSRNPFAFGRDAYAADALPVPAAPSSDATPGRDEVERAPGATPVDRFGLVLSGIAVTDVGDGEVARTAILTARTGEALLVRGGDSLPSNWRVVSVNEASVVLEHATGATRQLALP